MTDEELMHAFEAAQVPEGGFHHAQHVRVAWNYLRAHPLPEALGRFCAGLKRFAEAQGATGLYHETITVAYLLLINERWAGSDPATTWEAFAASHPDLLAWRPSLLDRLYAPETLASPRARRVFVMPDRLA
ncbi:MAG: hypothetical protein AB7Q16_14665 [Vicinamibacterales bacterium]